MSALINWNPFAELEDIHNRFASAWGVPSYRKLNRAEKSAWAPAVDISEDDSEYVISADLPNLDRKDVTVRVDDGVLLIKGERKQETEDKNKRFHRVERQYGAFVRQFELPADADSDKVGADFKNGVLTVHVPKSEATKPKSVEIKVA